MNKGNMRILVVDDEESIREGLREYLELEGYAVDSVESAEEAIAKGVAGYHLILLDVMMGGMDGFQLARRLRQSTSTADIPIIFLTAKDTDDDIVEGLHIGADDYIAKTFAMKILLARIEAVIRRAYPEASPSQSVVCDRAALTCRVDGQEVKLPRKEFEILALLLDHRGRIFTREELMKQVWPEHVVVVDRSVDVHITRIRSKIAPYGKCIVSRSGYGYGWQD
jgi:hypothetical protein